MKSDGDACLFKAHARSRRNELLIMFIRVGKAYRSDRDWEERRTYI